MTRCEEILTAVGEVQPLPGTVVRLISVINDPNSAITDIVEAIRYDQVLTARMLRICNSAFFGVSREVTCIEDALRLLGTLKTLQLVMAIHTSTLLDRGQKGYDLADGQLWRHSVGVAIASCAFAEHTRPANTSLAFTAGLLHDIGKVVLSNYVAREFAEIVRLVSEEGLAFNTAEQRVLGFSHDEIGARLAERWALPDAIVACIRHHHDPAGLPAPDPLVDTVYLANCACLLLGIGLGSDGLCYRADPAVMERYGLHEPQLETVGIQMLTELRRVEDAFACADGARACAPAAK